MVERALGSSNGRRDEKICQAGEEDTDRVTRRRIGVDSCVSCAGPDSMARWIDLGSFNERREERICDAKRGGCRWRNEQVFSLVGLWVCATGVLALPTGGYFNIFRKIRWLSSALHKDESLWDSELVVGLSIKEKEDLRGWVEVAVRNENW